MTLYSATGLNIVGGIAQIGYKVCDNIGNTHYRAYKVSGSIESLCGIKDRLTVANDTSAVNCYACFVLDQSDAE